MFVHTGVLPREYVCTVLLYTRSFTHNFFYTSSFTQKYFDTHTVTSVLRVNTLTWHVFYKHTHALLQGCFLDAFTQRYVYLRKDAFTQRCFHTQKRFYIHFFYTAMILHKGNLHTETVTNTRAFTKESIYIHGTFSYGRVCTDILLNDFRLRTHISRERVQQADAESQCHYSF